MNAKSVAEKVCTYIAAMVLLPAIFVSQAKAEECGGVVGYKHNMQCPFGMEHKTRLKWLNTQGASPFITLTVGMFNEDGDSGQGIVFFSSTDSADAVCSDRGCPGKELPCEETECGLGIGFITTVEITGNQEDFDNFFPAGIELSGGLCPITKVGRKYPVAINMYDPPSIIATPSNPNYKPMGYGARFGVLVETVYLYYEGCITDRKTDNGEIIVRVVKYVKPGGWMDDYRKRPPDPPSMREWKRVFGPVEQADIDWIEFRYEPSDWPCGGNCEAVQSMYTPITSLYAEATYHAVRIPDYDNTAPNTLAAAITRWGWQTNHDPAYFWRDMGTAGTIYYNCDTLSSETGKKLASNMEYCTAGQSRGQGTILWRFSYDANDRITQIYDGLSFVASERKYQFNWSHNQATGHDCAVLTYIVGGATVRQWNKEYNSSGLLVDSTDEHGKIRTEYYNVADYNDRRLDGVEKKVYNGAGEVVRYDVYDVNKLADEEYETMAQPVLMSQCAIKNPLGAAEVTKIKDFVYDPNNATKTEYAWITNSWARCVKYFYTDSSLKNLTKKVEYTQLAGGLVEPSGQTATTLYNYDDVNGVKTITYPSGKRADVQVYNAAKQIVQSYCRDVLNGVNAKAIVNTYSGKDIIKRMDEHGGETEYEYTAINGAAFVSVERGPMCEAGRQVKQYVYDGGGRVIEEIKKDPNGNEVSTKYIYETASEKIAAKIEAYGRGEESVTIYKYDEMGNVVRERSAAGVVSGKSYNLLGQLADEFVLANADDINVPDGAVTVISQTKYTYDIDGHVKTVSKAKHVGAFGFNNPGEWITTEYGYDFAGRKISQTEDVNGISLTTTYAYNNQGELEKTTYPSGRWEKTVRDGRGLVSQEITGQGSTNVLITNYEYDLNGNVSRQCNADGTVEVFEYDNFDRVAKKYKYSTAGPYTAYEYNGAGLVVCEMNCEPNGVVLCEMRKQYDAAGRVAFERVLEIAGTANDANDMVTIYKYDIAGNAVKTVRKGSGSINVSSISEPNDVVADCNYNAMNRLVRTVDAEGLATKFILDRDGRIAASIDPNGFESVNVYDGAGRVVKTIDAEKNYKINEIDSFGRIVRTTAYDWKGTESAGDDVAVEQVRFEYDNVGHLTRRAVMRNAGSVEAANTGIDKIEDFVYDEDAGLLYQAKKYYDVNETAVTTYYYDGIGRQSRVVDAGGNEKRTHFDTVYPGRIGFVEELHYSQSGTITVTTLYGYDIYGNVNSRTLKAADGTQIVTSLAYDGMGRRISVTAADGAVDVNVYDAMGNVVRIVRDKDGVGQRIDHKFDRLGRKIAQIAYGTEPQWTKFIYTKNGKLADVIYADGSRKRFYYDVAGKVDELIKRDGSCIYYSYDAVGRLLEETDSLTNATFHTEYEYDGGGRLTGATKVVDGATVAQSSFTYNGLGLKDSETVTYGGDANTTVVISYSYDQAGNIAGMSDNLANNSFAYTHDGLGRVEGVWLNGTQLAQYTYIGEEVKAVTYSQAGITSSKVLDKFARVEKITGATASETLLDLIYTYDNVFNRTSVKYNHKTPAVLDLYSYDGLGRLTEAAYGSSSTEEFDYDPLGNRLTVYGQNGLVTTYTHNALNQYTHTKMDFGLGFVIDANLSYDMNGNMELDDGMIGYEYDYAGRLTKIKSEATVLAGYEYDAMGRKIKSVMDGQTAYYYYDEAGRLIIEGTWVGGKIEPARNYIYGHGDQAIAVFFKEEHTNIDANDIQWLTGFCQSWLCESGSSCYQSQYDNDNSNSVDFRDFAYFVNSAGWHSIFSSFEETRYYYLRDAVGSAMAVIGGTYARVSDRKYYNYDAYGKVKSQSFIGNEQLYGAMRSAEIGNTEILEKNGRCYNPAFGNWMEPSESGANAYEFSRSDPISID